MLRLLASGERVVNVWELAYGMAERFRFFDVGFREEMEEGEHRFVASETGREGSGMREEAS